VTGEQVQQTFPLTGGDVAEVENFGAREVSEDVVRRAVAHHCMQHDQGLKHDLEIEEVGCRVEGRRMGKARE
jgi:hypothetical protein